MTHTFIVNTENVNEYGYRVLTDGIDYKQYLRNPIVLFMHERFNAKERGSEIIGKTVKLYKEDKKLIAEIEFDENDPFAKKIADKVAGGFIRMASMYASVKSTSSEPGDILPGQTLETVTKCKLEELSIVDIGGNDDAIKLSKNGHPIQLKKVNINQNRNMSQKLLTIALALGLAGEASEELVALEVQKLKLAKDTAESKVLDLENQLKGIRTNEATTLVESAVQLGLIPDVLKSTQIKAFEIDFDGQKAILSKMISDATATSQQNKTHQAVKEVVLASKQSSAEPDETFDYLQQFNVVKLAQIRDKEPEKYAELAKAYAAGVRHTPKN